MGGTYTAVFHFEFDDWLRTNNAQEILKSMHEEGHLKDLMDAGIREDRAPKGSMVRALESIMRN